MRTTYRVLTSGGSRRAYARGISPSLHAPAAAAASAALLMLLAAGGLRGARAAESSRVEEAGGRRHAERTAYELREALRREQEGDLEELLGRVAEPRRPDVHLALAQLHLEAANDMGRMASTWLEELSGAPDGAKSELLAAADEHEGRAAGYRGRAIKALEEALAGTDHGTELWVEGSTLLWRTLRASGDEERWPAVARVLADAVPESREGREAAFYLGLHLDRMAKVEEALSYFGMARGPDGAEGSDRLAARAVLWTAVCRTTLGQTAPASATYEEMIRRLGRDPRDKGLLRRAWEGYVRGLAFSMTFSQAWAHIRRVWKGPTARRLLPDIAERYFDARKYADSEPAFRTLLEGDPTPEKTLHARWRVVQSLAALGASGRGLTALDAAFRALRETMEAEQIRAWNDSPLGKEAEEVAAKLLFARTDQLVTDDGTSKKGTELDLTCLESFLACFPSTSRALFAHYALGNLLYARAEHGAAALRYRDAFSSPPAETAAAVEVEGIRRQSGERAVLSLAELAGRSPAGAGAEGDPCLSASDECLVATSEEYLSRHPCSEKAPVVRKLRVDALLRLGREGDAVADLADLVAGRARPERCGSSPGPLCGTPRVRHARDAGRRVLEVHESREEWKALAEDARRFKSTLGCGDQDYEDSLESVACKAGHRDALSSLATTGPSDPAAGAERLIAFARRHPACPEAPTALLDAGRGFHQAGRRRKAKVALDSLLVPEFEDNPLALEAAQELHEVCEELMDLPCAVRSLLWAARQAPCAQRVPRVGRAAALAEAVGERSRAHELRVGLVRECGHEPRAFEPLFGAGLAALEAGDLDVAREAFSIWTDHRDRDRDRATAARLLRQTVDALRRECLTVGGPTCTLGTTVKQAAKYAKHPPRGARAGNAVAWLHLAALSAYRARTQRFVSTLPTRSELAAIRKLARLLRAITVSADAAVAARATTSVRVRAVLEAAACYMETARAVRESPVLAPLAEALEAEMSGAAGARAEQALGLAKEPSAWRRKARLYGQGEKAALFWSALGRHLRPPPAAGAVWIGQVPAEATPGRPAVPDPVWHTIAGSEEGRRLLGDLLEAGQVSVPKAHAVRAWLELQSGELDLAEVFARFAEEGGWVGAAYVLAAVDLLRGRIEAAVERLGKASELLPDDPDIAILLGKAQAAGGREQRALAAFDAVLETWPGHGEARLWAGVAAASVGEVDEALEHLRKAIDAGEQTAYLVLGFLFLDHPEQRELVRQYLEAYQRAHPSTGDDDPVSQALRRLR